MVEDELDTWWANLTVSQKERIAGKLVSVRAGRRMDCLYPNCTNVWNDLPAVSKQIIHDHCTDAHGLVVEDFKEGKTFSY